MKKPLVILDWDGTISDSIGRIVHCFELVFQKVGLDRPPHQDIQSTIGLPLADAFEKLCQYRPASELVDHYRDFWLESPDLKPPTLLPGALETLKTLRQAPLHLTVATGKSRRGFQRESERFDLCDYFDSSVCAGEFEPKPHPDMLLELLRRFEVEAQDAWMVGDSVLDLEMARRAGIRPVGVLTGAGSESELAPYGTILQSLSEFPRLLPSL